MGRAADASPAGLESTTRASSYSSAARFRGTEVSPELALVDAELARAERARLDERAQLEAYKALALSATPPVDGLERGTRARLWRPRTGLVALLFAALVAVGLAAAWYAAGDRNTGASPPQREQVLAAPPAGPYPVKPAVIPRPRTSRLPPAWMLERRILALVDEAAPSNLPRPLVNARTRSVRRGLEATCHRAGARSFTCVVAPPRHPRNEGLYVRYRMRKDGSSVFVWLGYRR